MYRSADGSLTGSGIWSLAVGTLLVLSAIGNLAGRGPLGRRAAQNYPRSLVVAGGIFGLLVGSFFLLEPFLAKPGVLY
ncbi:hypothetical protein [Nocardioides cynanchi]|uniref:hypothetical protein n=1 Tax=Nocardioides cynanchi TaxID=2558918 RepID=UPI0012441133|nr:hypothetical protein [Nocardioides cynanchi]